MLIKIQGGAAHRVTIRLTWSRPPSFTVFCVTELLPGFIVSNLLFKIVLPNIQRTLRLVTY